MYELEAHSSPSDLRRPHVLVVDDDREHRLLLAALLNRNGLRVSLAGDGPSALKLIAGALPDLMLLDVMLPGEDGLSLCRRIRSASRLPIIMLTALGQGIDKVAGLDTGADDYVAKPFDPEELLARIRAVMRRVDLGAPTSLDQAADVSHAGRRRYRFERWTVDAARREVVSPDGVQITFTSGEFDLLLAFCDHPQVVLSRDHLVELTTGRSSAGANRSIDILVSRVRRKLETAGQAGPLVKTVRNGGYIFIPAVGVGSAE